MVYFQQLITHTCMVHEGRQRQLYTVQQSIKSLRVETGSLCSASPHKCFHCKTIQLQYKLNNWYCSYIQAQPPSIPGLFIVVNCSGAYTEEYLRASTWNNWRTRPMNVHLFNSHYIIPTTPTPTRPLHFSLVREYWIICRGPGFLAVVWFGSSPTLSPLPSASCLSFSILLCVASRAYWRERGWSRSQTYDGEKVWSSINHSITLYSILCSAKRFLMYCQ